LGIIGKTGERGFRLRKEISPLIDILIEERDHYKSLLQIAQEEQEMIVSGKLDDLGNTVAAIEKFLTICRGLEKKRLDIFRALTRSMKLEGVENLSELYEHLDDSASKQIKDIQKEMSDILKKLSEVSKNNAELLRKNLNYVDFLLKSLTDEQIYQSDAKKKKSPDAKLFNKKV